MRPLTMVTGVILGTCLSITVSLSLVLVVYLLLAGQYPRLHAEFSPLISSLLIFLTMTMISAASFYALLIDHRARYWGQLLMWGGLLAAGLYYWP